MSRSPLTGTPDEPRRRHTSARRPTAGAPDDDAAAVLIARAELTSILGLDAAPVLARVHRWDDIMPRYTVGHRARVTQIRERLTETLRSTWRAFTIAPITSPDTTGSPRRGATLEGMMEALGVAAELCAATAALIATGRPAR